MLCSNVWLLEVEMPDKEKVKGSVQFAPFWISGLYSYNGTKELGVSAV